MVGEVDAATMARRKKFRRESDQRMYDMAHNASQDALAAIGKIEQHEAVCTERWTQSRSSLQKLEPVPQQITELRHSVKLLMSVLGWGGTAFAAGACAVIWYFTTSFMDAVRSALQAMGKPVP